jgi:hypothetical protein
LVLKYDRQKNHISPTLNVIKIPLKKLITTHDAKFSEQTDHDIMGRIISTAIAPKIRNTDKINKPRRPIKTHHLSYPYALIIIRLLGGKYLFDIFTLL